MVLVNCVRVNCVRVNCVRADYSFGFISRNINTGKVAISYQIIANSFLYH